MVAAFGSLNKSWRLFRSLFLGVQEYRSTGVQTIVLETLVPWEHDESVAGR
jgi:hypothetical protein